jgi:aromatic-amino-acid transaminase
MYKHVEAYPGDPILSLMEDFLKDPREKKVNLGIGLYYDNDGKIPVLKSVKAAIERITSNLTPRTYLPMEGPEVYRTEVQRLVFGADNEAVKNGRIATMQSLGGSGALHIGARFIKTYLPGSDVWISDPTWDNHRSLMESAGLKVHTYPYYNAAKNGIDFAAMLATLETLPAKSVLLLQPSCHNPTGHDLSAEQMDEVIALAKRRNLIPFVDMAYQGFGNGIEEDAAPIRKMVAADLPILVSSSFSKNFSLYGERVGGLSILCDDAGTAGRVLGQLKSTVRKVYSSPALFGAQVVSTVLSTQELAKQWRGEADEMRTRIKAMRGTLREVLRERLPDMNADYLTQQQGMFSYTGLTAAEVDFMRETHGVYLVRSGRMCVAGLNERNALVVAEAFADVMARRQK